MASSAVYRYFASRDELLTALIVDAYNAIGAAAEEAESAVARHDLRGRWQATCRAARKWALAHPHEYALVYGSPVPGYEAPESTIGPASRTPIALMEVLRDAARAGLLRVPDDGLAPELDEQAARTAGLADLALPEPVVVRGVIAWTQLFGMIGFELFGHLDRTMDPAGAFFAHTVELMADFVGLPPAAGDRR
jgi:AcrR family transcriptional regulator